MFSNISTKTKLLVPAFTLTLVLLFLGMLVIKYSYAQINSLKILKTEILYSQTISKLVHSLQKERGLSSGYIENKNDKFEKELLKQRKQTDIVLDKLMHVNSKQIASMVNKKELSKVRDKVDKKELTSMELIRIYSDINNKLLQKIASISKDSHIPVVTQNLLAYTHFLYLKEYGGIERAFGVIILSSTKHMQSDIIAFNNLIAIQRQHKKLFLAYADNKIKKYFNNFVSKEKFKNVFEIERRIATHKIHDIHIEPMEWFRKITKKLDTLDKVGCFIQDDTKKLIGKELSKVQNIFYFVALLTLFSFGVFILMLVAFLRLAKEEQRLRLVSQKYIISSTTNTKGIITDASDAFCEISGYSREELIGKPHNIVRHPDMPKEVFADLWATIKQGKAWTGKVKNLKKDGGFYWVWANIEPLYDSKGNVDSYISIRLDITENELLAQKVEEERNKSQVAKEMMYQQSRLAQMGEMMSMIAHQWRQPLSAITAASGAIALKAKLNKLDAKSASELANKINSFSLHLSQTIDDFRNFFKTNKKAVETDFNTIFKSAFDIVKSSFENHRVELDLDVKSSKSFETYESEVKQVILNLLKNAEDALLENNVQNPKISVTINDNVCIVSDNAGGIPDEIMKKIFDPYFSTKKKKDGTGLGLYMSKTIVEEHCGGSLHVENDEFGAKFTIDLRGGETKCWI